MAFEWGTLTENSFVLNINVNIMASRRRQSHEKANEDNATRVLPNKSLMQGE